MPPPLNLPFLIGNDICRVARIRRVLQGRLGPRFVHRILTTEEIQHPTTARILRCILDPTTHDAPSHPRGSVGSDATLTPGAAGLTRAVEFMAGRFAAKEAVIKAHPHRRLTFQSIAILRATFGADSPAGSPLVDASGRIREDTVEEREIRPGDDASTSRSGPLVALIKAAGAYADSHASVSISHDTEYATAVCLGISPAFSLISSVEAKPSA
ncbi:hypothetical protein F4861DRAFT_145427 [Xylaria intraflava]|nr:hypothetical protein F4861DRAFT_145427 [Xylaria intraflava]